MVSMVNWQKSAFAREPRKTKAELREMLTEAVRNTQASAKHVSKAEDIPAADTFVD
jgi:hypothetical protein